MDVSVRPRTETKNLHDTMKWKNYQADNSYYFITTTLREFIPLFNDEKIVKIVLDSLEYLREHAALKLYAYVIMPEHLHLIAGIDKASITEVAGAMKSFTSREIAKYLRDKKTALFAKLKKAAYKNQNYAVWQETFRSEVIYEGKFLRQKLNYIHNNPVKRGLVEKPGDWKHSSFKQIESGIVREGEFIMDSFEA